MHIMDARLISDGYLEAGVLCATIKKWPLVGRRNHFQGQHPSAGRWREGRGRAHHVELPRIEMQEGAEGHLIRGHAPMVPLDLSLCGSTGYRPAFLNNSRLWRFGWPKLLLVKPAGMVAPYLLSPHQIIWGSMGGRKKRGGGVVRKWSEVAWPRGPAGSDPSQTAPRKR